MAGPMSYAGPWVAWLAERLLTASVQGAIVVAVVGLVCWRIRSMPPSARAALWWLASLKFMAALLALPSLPLPVLPPDEPISIPHAAAVVAIDSIQATATTAHPGPDSSAAPDVSPVPSWLFAVIGLWVAGVTAHALRLAATARRLRRVLRESTPVGANEAAVAGRIAEDIGLRIVPDIRVSDDVDTPQVVRARRPVVLLPANAVDRLTLEERAMAIAHELMHVRRRDLLLGWVPACAERLFFFHPLARLAAGEYVVAREAACDAAVVQALGVAPRDYGRVLMRLGISGTDPGLSAAVSARSFSSLSRRLDMLQHSAPSPRRAAWLMAAGLMALAMVPVQLVARQAAAPEGITGGTDARITASDALQVPTAVSGSCEISGASPASANWTCDLTASFRAEAARALDEADAQAQQARAQDQRAEELAALEKLQQELNEVARRAAARPFVEPSRGGVPVADAFLDAMARAQKERLAAAEEAAQRASQDELALRSEEMRRTLEAVRAIAQATEQSRLASQAPDGQRTDAQQREALDEWAAYVRETQRALARMLADQEPAAREIEKAQEDVNRAIQLNLEQARQQIEQARQQLERARQSRGKEPPRQLESREAQKAIDPQAAISAQIAQLQAMRESVDRQVQEVLKQQQSLLAEQRRLSSEAERIHAELKRVQREAARVAKEARDAAPAK
jgi:beta-lactamase regulating signal transducer with metallopeptidase domain